MPFGREVDLYHIATDRKGGYIAFAKANISYLQSKYIAKNRPSGGFFLNVPTGTYHICETNISQRSYINCAECLLFAMKKNIDEVAFFSAIYVDFIFVIRDNIINVKMVIIISCPTNFYLLTINKDIWFKY